MGGVDVAGVMTGGAQAGREDVGRQPLAPTDDEVAGARCQLLEGGQAVQHRRQLVERAVDLGGGLVAGAPSTRGR